mgnify:CR=1 FL=1
MAEKFVNVHNPYNEIELGDDQALLEAARNATYVINTIPGHAADNVADALAMPEPSHSPDCCWT